MRHRQLFFLCLLLFLIATPFWGQARWVVANPVVNIYSEPSLDKDVVSQAIYGATVTELESSSAAPSKTEEWVHVKTADEYPGWIERAHLLPGDHANGAAGARTVSVASRSANVYREQDVTEHAPLLTLPYGTTLEVAGVPKTGAKRWLEIRLVDGKTGWIQRGDVQEQLSKPLNVAQTIALAKKFLGVTYTWGGTSSFGYDCSGFMQMLMRARGRFMPRDADQQAAWTGVASVKRAALKPGDLLYFGSSAQKITHTGMYIGNGRFIHDTTHEHPMVQISRLNDQPWTKILVACRRAK